MKLGFQDQFSFKAGQKYCRMLQGERSALHLTFIKLPFVIKIFVLSNFEWPFYTGFTVIWKTCNKCRTNCAKINENITLKVLIYDYFSIIFHKINRISKHISLLYKFVKLTMPINNWTQQFSLRIICFEKIIKF